MKIGFGIWIHRIFILVYRMMNFEIENEVLKDFEQVDANENIKLNDNIDNGIKIMGMILNDEFKL